MLKKQNDSIYEKLGPNYSRASIKQGEMVNEAPIYRGKVKKLEFPDHALNEHDFHQRLKFEELKKTKLEEMCNWK